MAFDIAQTVWEDDETHAILTRFARELAATQHGLQWGKLAGGAAFELMLTAILTALTAGAGVAVTLGGKAARLQKLGESLRDKAAPLKRFRQRWTYGRHGKPGAGGRGGVVVDEVEVPGYNEPLKGKPGAPSGSAPTLGKSQSGPEASSSHLEQVARPENAIFARFSISPKAGAGGQWMKVIDEIENPNVSKQVTRSSCGQAGCQMVLNDRGVDITQGEVIKELGHDSVTSPGEIVTTLSKISDKNNLPIKWEYDLLDPDANEISRVSESGPWMAKIQTDFGDVGHWVVVDGIDDAGRVMIRDPWGKSHRFSDNMSGSSYKMEANDFIMDNWTGTGFAGGTGMFHEMRWVQCL